MAKNTKTTRLLKQMKGQKFEPKTPIAEGMFLPNVSGDHQKSIKRNAPNEGFDLVNKDYVDAAISGGLVLFMTEDASADIATYYTLVPTPTGAAEENIITAVTGTAGTLMAAYASVLNCPCVSNLFELSDGVVTVHLHAKGGIASKMSFYFELYKRDNLDVETLLATSEDSNLLTTASSSYAIHASLTTPVDWVSTDRIVIKVYGKNTLAVAKNLTIYTEGTTASRVELSGNVPVGNYLTTSGGTINSTYRLNFRDNTMYIHSPSATNFDINFNNKLTISKSGVEKMEVNTDGINITGDITCTGEGAKLAKVLIDTYEGDDANSKELDLGDDYDEIDIYLEESEGAGTNHFVRAHAIKTTYGAWRLDIGNFRVSHEAMAQANPFFQGKMTGADANKIKLGSTGNFVQGTNASGKTYRIIAKKYADVQTLP